MSKKDDKPLVIFGTGELGQLACYYFTHDSSRDVAAFTVNNNHLEDSECMGLPVVAFEELITNYPPEDYDMFVAIGYTKLNQYRAEKCSEAKNLGYKLATYISSRCSTWPDLVIGENCLIMEDNTIQPFVRIGNNVIIWCGSLISHHVEIENNCFIAAQTVIAGNAKIGSYSFIGMNATIRDKISLAKHTIVGAGALVLKDTDENSAYLASDSPKADIPSNRLQSLL